METNILVIGPSYTSEKDKEDFQREVMREIANNTESKICVFFFHKDEPLVTFDEIFKNNSLKGVIFSKEVEDDYLMQLRFKTLEKVELYKKKFEPSFIQIGAKALINGDILSVPSYKMAFRYLVGSHHVITYYR